MALADAMANNRLAVLAGAGISRLGPSFLPDWFGFNRAILEEAKACVLRGIPSLDAAARTALQGLAIEQIPVEAFSDLLVRSFAAEGYFTVLDVLDSEQSNANHQALAALAKRGVLRAIVTTNFDTLIERAFRDAGVPLQVVTTEAPLDDGRTTLYKIHGSVTATATLVDTVSQKRRGLPAPLRQRLAQLYRTHHVLVLGYSGGDLRFGGDYLAFEAIDADSPGFTWVTRPGSNLAREVVVLRDRVGERGEIVTAALPEFFATLGLDVPVVPVGDDGTAQRQAEERAALRIRKFFDEPYVGPFSSAAFCAGLLSRLDQRQAATAVRDALAVEAERWGGRVPKTAAGVFRTIAKGRMDDGDLAGAERWTRMEISFWETAKTYLTAETAPEALATWQRNMAAVLLNLCVVDRAQEKLDDARAALARAVELAKASDHRGLQAEVFRQAASLAWQGDDDHDLVIELWRNAISASVDDGGARQVADASIELAEVLLRLGEYDVAWNEVERASKQTAFAVDADAAQRIDIVRAAVNARRGSASSAVRRLEPFVRSQPADTPHGARVRAALAGFIGYHAPLSGLAVGMLDDVIAAMREGRLAERGLSHVPERQNVETLRNAILEGGVPAITALVQVPGNDKEALLRGQIVLAELTQFLSVLPLLFERLCHMKRAQGRWLRVMDLAMGLFQAAKRSGDADRQLAGMNFFAMGWAVTGYVPTAIAELERALATAAAGLQRDAIEQNLRILRQGSSQPLADVLLSPEVDRPLPPRDARIWAEANEQHDLADTLLVLLTSRQPPA